MDENKGNIISDEEKKLQEISEVFSEEDNDEADGTETADVNEASDAVQEDSGEPKPAKKRPVQFPIIISAVLVAATLLAFLIIRCFFNTSIVGTWTVDTVTSTSDEAGESENYNLVYYTFNADKTLKIMQGTMNVVTDYQVYEDEEGTTYMYSAYFGEEYAYAISGNVFTGRKMVLTSSASTGALVSASAVTPKLEVSEDFKPDETLTGKWSIPDYGVTYEFRNDGTFSFNQSDMYFYDGTYTYTDEELIVTYCTSTTVTTSIPYGFDGDNVLVINGLGYYRINDDGTLASTADEA